MHRSWTIPIAALSCITILAAGCAEPIGHTYCDGESIYWESPAWLIGKDCSWMCSDCWPNRSFDHDLQCENLDGQVYCPCGPNLSATLCPKDGKAVDTCDTKTCP